MYAIYSRLNFDQGEGPNRPAYGLKDCICCDRVELARNSDVRVIGTFFGLVSASLQPFSQLPMQFARLA